jgi:LysM repeat protein
MTYKKKLRLNRFVLVLIAVSVSALTACSAVGGLLPGGEEPPAPVPEELPVAEALPEEEAAEPEEEPSPPTPMPSATPMVAEEEPSEELVVPEADKESEEATPTPSTLEEETTVVEVTPLGGDTTPEPEATLEGEMTPEATVEAETTPEATLEEDVTPELDATPEPPSATVVPTIRTYTVKAGDTLGEIAQANNTTIAEIVALNQGTYPSLKTNPDKIEVGWVLKLAPSGETYTVQQADTLDEIATEFGTTIEMLISLNEDSYPSLRTNPGELEIGWVLLVP